MCEDCDWFQIKTTRGSLLPPCSRLQLEDDFFFGEARQGWLESEAINFSNKNPLPLKTKKHSPEKMHPFLMELGLCWCFFPLRSQDRLWYKETRRPYRTPLVAWAGAFGSIQRGEAHVILVKGDDRSRSVFFFFRKKTSRFLVLPGFWLFFRGFEPKTWDTFKVVQLLGDALDGSKNLSPKKLKGNRRAYY